MKINLIRKDFALYPATDEDMEKMLKLKKGAPFEANVKQVRNYPFLRKFFALINVSWEFLNEQQQEFFHNSKEGFRHTLTMAAGYYDTIYSVSDQQWVQTPKSISFDKMSEAEFDKLYESVVNVIFKLFLERVDKEQFYEALKDF